MKTDADADARRFKKKLKNKTNTYITGVQVSPNGCMRMRIEEAPPPLHPTPLHKHHHHTHLKKKVCYLDREKASSSNPALSLTENTWKKKNTELMLHRLSGIVSLAKLGPQRHSPLSNHLHLAPFFTLDKNHCSSRVLNAGWIKFQCFHYPLNTNIVTRMLRVFVESAQNLTLEIFWGECKA